MMQQTHISRFYDLSTQFLGRMLILFCVQLHNSTLLKQTANILLVWINKLIAYFITVVGNRNIWLSKQHYAAKNHAGVVTLCIFCVERLVCRVHNRLVCRVHLHNFVALLEFSGHWPSVWWFYVFSLYAGGIEEWGYGLTSKLSWAELSDCFLAVLVQHMWFRVASNMVVISHRKALQPAGLIIQSPD